tara:strand:+ start:284 stop:937 length:654 start_codon:yes stop_codon:yes gene_type:complete
MNYELKKRVLTSVILILLLSFTVASNFILGYVLIIISIFSLLEFHNILKRLTKTKINLVLFNLLFAIYLLIISGLFLIISFIFHLKVLLFTILLICVASDIGGFAFGKVFKGRKLTSISPNKTISGSIGAILFSTLTACLSLNFVVNENILSLVIAGFVISLSVQIGDLIFSYLKRKAKLKNTGNILPGHGGILDRIDGILLGVPIGFIILILLSKF